MDLRRWCSIKRRYFALMPALVRLGVPRSVLSAHAPAMRHREACWAWRCRSGEEAGGGAGEGEHLFGVRAAGGAAALPRVAVEDRRGARKRSLGKAAHVQILHACARTVTARRYA